MVRYVVKLSDSGERLDVSVTKHLDNISRSIVGKFCDDGKVKVNNKVQKASYKIKRGDRVVIDYDPSLLEQIPSIDLPITYEDDDCVVIDKPTGVLSHSKGAFNQEATVATWLKSRTKNMEGERAGIVHRLDRATSGVMIAAKTPEALAWLQKQFSQRKVKKTYMALIEAQLEPLEAIIDMPIERNPKKPQTFRVGPNGKPAVTAYKIIKSDDLFSLVELKPTTGRTHQLRVHLKQLGHPILGDNLYGGKNADRLFLHASELEITLPNRKRRVFSSALPANFSNIIK